MNMKEKEKDSLVLSILSIIFVFGLPLLSIIFGVLGLVSASLHQKESGLDYTTEKILSIIGIFLSVVSCIVFISQLSGIH